MLATFIIGAILFGISILLSLLIAFGAMLKNVGATSFGIFSTIFFLIFPCFCFAGELAMYYFAPHVWEIAYFFIAINAYFLALQYFFL